MKRPIQKLGTMLVLAGSMLALPLAAQNESERELAELRAEIGRLEQELERQIGRRDDGMAELREIEVGLAASRTELRSLAEAIAAQARRRDEIAVELQAANATLGEAEAALAEQVRMTYMTGRQELVRLVLSQESPSDFGRMLVYYDYLNRHRGEQIAMVNADLARIAELARQSDANRAELERLQAAEQAEVAALEERQERRAALVRELDAAIGDSGARIERMRAEEARLNEVIARLAEVVAGFAVSSDAPFSEQRGALPWPVEGRVAAGFDDFRDTDGRVRWSGVLLEAGAGTVVRAVYHGRVIYSEWSPGMGLLLILDHGEGYWSLYGHNAALLREAGDSVVPGEAIAEVGNTGGQHGTGLFFGIRKDTVPVDPADWVR